MPKYYFLLEKKDKTLWKLKKAHNLFFFTFIPKII